MKLSLLTGIIAITLLAACSNEPEPINFGQDNCAHCKMMITDQKYGAELVTDKAKIYKYDSIECLLEQLHIKIFSDKQISSMWVIDFSHPGTLIDAKTAFYTKNDEFRSPMGLNVQAFQNEDVFNKFFNENGGEKLNWSDLMKFAGQMHR